jgi:hypothetical protein
MPTKRERFMLFFRENRLLKLLALALATASVYAIQRITNKQEEFEIPIAVQMEKGVAVLRQDARTAVITCRGSFDDLKRLEPSQLRLVASPRVSGVSGTAQVPIGPKNIEGPLRGVSVIRVRPGIVNLTFDREIIRNIAIAKPELAGAPLLGRAEVDYEPKIASVRGPKTQLADLKILRTGPIDVDGAVDSFTQRIRIVTDTESGVWAVEPAEITARVNIVTEAISREWKSLPILALHRPGTSMQVRFSPSRVDLSVLGSPQAVNRIESGDIRIFVDCLDISEPGTYEVAAGVHLPDGVEVSTAVNPPMVKVTLIQSERAAESRDGDQEPAAVPDDSDASDEITTPDDQQ